jgi:hypothetical protein
VSVYVSRAHTKRTSRIGNGTIKDVDYGPINMVIYETIYCVDNGTISFARVVLVMNPFFLSLFASVSFSGECGKFIRSDVRAEDEDEDDEDEDDEDEDDDIGRNGGTLLYRDM